MAGSKSRSERKRQEQKRGKLVFDGCCDREQDRTRNVRMSDKGTKKRGRKIDGTWLEQGREYFDRGNDEDINM